MQVLVFRLNAMRFGIGIDAVERVFPSCEIAPLPGAPEAIAGVINLHGSIVPVVDLRRRFEHHGTQLRLDHRFIVIQTSSGRRLALIADEVLDAREFSSEAIAGVERLSPGLGTFTGVAAVNDGLIYVQASDLLLSASEEVDMDRCLVDA